MAVNGLGQPAEHAAAVVGDLRGLAVHHLGGTHDVAAEDLADALVAEAHAEHGDAGAAEGADGVDRHTDVSGSSGLAGTRRHQHRVGLERDAARRA